MMKKTVSLLLVLLLLPLTFLTNAAPQTEAPAQSDLEFEGFLQACENENFSLSYDQNGLIFLRDKHTGAYWYSNPPGADTDDQIKGIGGLELSSMLIVEYFDEKNQMGKVNSYFESVRNKDFEITPVENGLRIAYHFPDKSLGFVIPVEITLESDHMSVAVKTKEIKENAAAKILRISLMPFFGAGSKDDSGYMLIPDGSGALINFNNGKGTSDQYNEPVYGREPAESITYTRTVKEQIYLPVFGIQKNGSAFLGIVEGGEFSAHIFANAAGSVNSPYANNAGASFAYRKADNVILSDTSFTVREITLLATGVNDFCDFSVAYYPLGKDEADYNGMAKRYREYLTKEKKVSSEPLNPERRLAVELIGGIQTDGSFLGIPVKKFIPLTTYEDAIQISRELLALDIDSLSLTYTGWLKNGVQQSPDTAFKPESKLGGKKGFRELAEYAQQNNIQLYPDVEFLKLYKNNGGINRRYDSVKSVSNIPMALYKTRPDFFRKNTDSDEWYLLKHNLLEKSVSRFLKGFAEYGTGISLGSMGRLVYSDFAKNNNIYRDEGAAVLTEQVQHIKEQTNGLLASGCNAYLLPYVTEITNVPVSASGFDVCDAEIPFYQMAVSGLVRYSAPPINLTGDTRSAFLKAVQTGSDLCCRWIYNESSLLKKTELNGVFAAGYADWSQNAKESFEELSGKLPRLSGQKIIEFSAIGKDLTVTVYEDGTKVYVNLSDKDAVCEGIAVPAYDFAAAGAGL